MEIFSIIFKNNQEGFKLQFLISILIYSPLNSPINTTNFFQVFNDSDKNVINIHNAKNLKEFFVDFLRKL
jgi:hypothetical protein